MEIQDSETNSSDLVDGSFGIERIIANLVQNKSVVFKSQQRGEDDLTESESANIAQEIYTKSKMTFLNRFGKYLSLDDLEHFRQYESDTYEEGYDIKLLLRTLMQSSQKMRMIKRNRRYAALKELVSGNSYFSELEMMKRNPLLYEQLVGQYMSEREKKDRDKFDSESITFVSLLMEGIERDQADLKRKIQRESEDNAMVEEEGDTDEDNEDTGKDWTRNNIQEPKPSTSKKWGEFADDEPKAEDPIRRYAAYTTPQKHIATSERELLRNEFTTLMYTSFLEGKDEEFDYDSVDNNEKYDNIETINHDEEAKYFDEDDDDDMAVDENAAVESSEDELDMYMNALNQHPTVCQLSQDLKRL